MAGLDNSRPHIRVRGIYGGVPTQLFERGETLADFGVNAIFLGSGSLSAERIALLKSQGARVFAEFNSMHEAGYLEAHPEAAPVGPDGQICPPPDGWQGVCPTHPGYREHRMQSFQAVLESYDVDGIWLDYHHTHASWEQAEPNLPDTCFCDRCVAWFAIQSGTKLPDQPRPEQARYLLAERREAWVRWRCAVFTDWVREYRQILNATRPGALLGTFHCPWTDTEHRGALRDKLAIDLKAQAEYVDVFSIMPYHARFGHATEPEWISRQVAWLGEYLGIKGQSNERHQIWPIVQLSDWGEAVPVSQVHEALDYGTRSPASGVMVFAWGSLQSEPEKVEAMGEFYRTIGGE